MNDTALLASGLSNFPSVSALVDPVLKQCKTIDLASLCATGLVKKALSAVRFECTVALDAFVGCLCLPRHACVHTSYFELDLT